MLRLVPVLSKINSSNSSLFYIFLEYLYLVNVKFYLYIFNNHLFKSKIACFFFLAHFQTDNIFCPHLISSKGLHCGTVELGIVSYIRRVALRSPLPTTYMPIKF